MLLESQQGSVQRPFGLQQFGERAHQVMRCDSPSVLTVQENASGADELSAAARESAANMEDVRDQVGVEDIMAFEEQTERIPSGAIVLIRTGFGDLWPDPEQYLGTAERGQEAALKLHFPGLHPSTAKWLVNERAIRAVGIDTASIDYGQSRLFHSHRELFKHNVPAFENVANLDQLPLTGAWVIALPMKIRGGSGAPLRIVALVTD